MAPKNKIAPIQDLFSNWYGDYASYVILQRAVPRIEDGLKPSQRRCLFSLNELDDGRYNKLAGLIGNTMKYHPHGDQSLYDTFVHIGQKNWLIDTQGNWGNTITGESAAAPRYIEARLTPFAKEVLFNPKTTKWIPTYDGRNKEPITLPVKFPLLPLLGTSGIAVSLACAILPHNFLELCDASIDALRNKPFTIFPDFPNGGDVDTSNYLDGKEKGKVRIRAHIEIRDKHTLAITELPYGITTTTLLENIVAVTQKGKLKIKGVEDLSGENPEVLITLAPGTDPETTKSALFAFTKCEISHSTNTQVIKNQQPKPCSTTHLIQESAQNTKEIIREELTIHLEELEIRHMRLSLEKIFIENEIYEKLKTAETFEEGLARITKALQPHYPNLRREPTPEEIHALTEIRLRRIGKYDAAAHQDRILQTETEETEELRLLANLTKTTIAYFKDIKKKYGQGQERKSRLHPEGFQKIDLEEVDAQSLQIYWNPIEGFLGTNLKKDEALDFQVSPLTDVQAISRNGILKINRIGEKTFFAEDLLDARIFPKNGDAPTYYMIYEEKSTGRSFAKAFQINTGFVRDKAYFLAGGQEENKILYLKIVAPGEPAPQVTAKLKPVKRVRLTEITLDFNSIEIKNREAKGKILTKNKIASIK